MTVMYIKKFTNIKPKTKTKTKQNKTKQKNKTKQNKQKRIVSTLENGPVHLVIKETLKIPTQVLMIRLVIRIIVLSANKISTRAVLGLRGVWVSRFVEHVVSYEGWY